MLYGREESYQVKRPVLIEDAYNHSRTGYEDAGSALVHIVVQDRTNINSNDMALYKTTLVGYTRDTNIDKGWIIDNKYIVKTTVPHRTARILYLEELSNGR